MTRPTTRQSSAFPAQPYIRYAHPVEEFEKPLRAEEDRPEATPRLIAAAWAGASAFIHAIIGR